MDDSRTPDNPVMRTAMAEDALPAISVVAPPAPRSSKRTTGALLRRAGVRTIAILRLLVLAGLVGLW